MDLSIETPSNEYTQLLSLKNQYQDAKNARKYQLASWYGNQHHGRKTASGERFNQYDFTAAHRTLPFGTRVVVIYEGKSVVVRINDRGPFVGGREIDLSRAAAEKIGLDGVGRVLLILI
jgi:rare lipoprotein A